MSIITTTYTERLTITTDDAGNVTTSRTHRADTLTAYLFCELAPEAQERAIHDAIEEEQEDYYQNGAYGFSQTGISEAEIWNAAEDLEEHQPIHIGTDAGGSPYGTARRYRWNVADWQAVTEQQHTGICYSMDICDTWNAYAARIIVLQEAYDEATARAYIHDENADTADDRRNFDDMPDEERDHLRAVVEAERSRAAFYEDIAERIENAAEELTEDAARAVGNVVDSLIEAERDYYQSPEFWREWLTDSDDRYARDGARI